MTLAECFLISDFLTNYARARVCVCVSRKGLFAFGSISFTKRIIFPENYFCFSGETYFERLEISRRIKWFISLMALVVYSTVVVKGKNQYSSWFLNQLSLWQTIWSFHLICPRLEFLNRLNLIRMESTSKLLSTISTYNNNTRVREWRVNGRPSVRPSYHGYNKAKSWPQQVIVCDASILTIDFVARSNKQQTRYAYVRAHVNS